MQKSEEDCSEETTVRSSTSAAGKSDSLKNQEGKLSEKQELHLVPNHTGLPAPAKKKSKKPCHNSSDNQ